MGSMQQEMYIKISELEIKFFNLMGHIHDTEYARAMTPKSSKFMGEMKAECAKIDSSIRRIREMLNNFCSECEADKTRLLKG